MTDCFLGELRIFSYGWAPQYWALCNGQTLASAQNQALYALIGTQFGGTSSQFALPNLQGRVALGITTFPNNKPNGVVSNYTNGTTGGAETVAITLAQTPAHTHAFGATDAPATSPQLRQNIYADVIGTQPTYVTNPTAAQIVNLDPAAIAPTGSGAGHANVQPFTVVNFCIATTGVFPSRN